MKQILMFAPFFVIPLIVIGWSYEKFLDELGVKGVRSNLKKAFYLTVVYLACSLIMVAVNEIFFCSSSMWSFKIGCIL